jgi:Fic family protein
VNRDDFLYPSPLILPLILGEHWNMTTLKKEWHRKLYRFSEEPGGSWKKKDNDIIEIGPEGKQYIRFKTVSTLATPEFIERLIALFIHALDERKTDPLFLIASFVLDFECIHPFMDGNGRIGRLFTLLLLYQSGYEAGRYISFERIVEESKETYYVLAFVISGAEATASSLDIGLGFASGSVWDLLIMTSTWTSFFL